MSRHHNALVDRHFWASLYLAAFGQVGERTDETVVCSCLGVNEDEVTRWYREFSGWRPGLLDETDGFVDDPATVSVPLAHNVELCLEIHPGELSWHLRGDGEIGVLLATVGPHWALPGLRWQEVAAIAAVASGPGWTPTLLLLPTVWLTAGDEMSEARAMATSAWSASGLVSDESATKLADLWVRAVEGGRAYRWERISDEDWACTAEWSTRGAGRGESRIAAVNRIVTSTAYRI